MEVLLNILVAMLGIALYTIFTAKNFVAKQDWDWQKFVMDNAKQVIWSILAALAIITTLAAVPGSADAIKTITGLDLPVQDDGSINRVAYLTLGFLLSVFIRTGGK